MTLLWYALGFVWLLRIRASVSHFAHFRVVLVFVLEIKHFTLSGYVMGLLFSM